MMYVFEYFIYHLKPYGVSSNLVLPSDKYKEDVNRPTTHYQNRHSADNESPRPQVTSSDDTALKKSTILSVREGAGVNNDEKLDSAGSGKKQNGWKHQTVKEAKLHLKLIPRRADRVRKESPAMDKNRIK